MKPERIVYTHTKGYFLVDLTDITDLAVACFVIDSPENSSNLSKGCVFVFFLYVRESSLN